MKDRPALFKAKISVLWLYPKTVRDLGDENTALPRTGGPWWPLSSDWVPKAVVSCQWRVGAGSQMALHQAFLTFTAACHTYTLYHTHVSPTGGDQRHKAKKQKKTSAISSCRCSKWPHINDHTMWFLTSRPPLEIHGWQKGNKSIFSASGSNKTLLMEGLLSDFSNPAGAPLLSIWIIL